MSFRAQNEVEVGKGNYDLQVKLLVPQYFCRHQELDQGVAREYQLAEMKFFSAQIFTASGSSCSNQKSSYKLLSITAKQLNFIQPWGVRLLSLDYKC